MMRRHVRTAALVLLSTLLALALAFFAAVAVDAFAKAVAR